MLSGFETLQYPLAFAGRQVRILRPIVQTLVSSVLGVRQHLSNGRQVACECVRDHDARFSTQLALKHLKQKAFSSCLITPLLDKDVEYDSVLIDGAPQPVALPADLERHLVQMPLVAGTCTPTTESRGVARAELRAPCPDGLVADDDAALGEQILNVTEAEVETKVQPHGVSDDLGREAVTAIE